MLGCEDVARCDPPCYSETDVGGESSPQQEPIATYSDMLVSFATVDGNVFFVVFVFYEVFCFKVLCKLLQILPWLVYTGIRARVRPNIWFFSAICQNPSVSPSKMACELIYCALDICII